MYAADIVMGAPAWVYVVFVALAVLGVRRLRTREMPVLVALIPTGAFLIWSMVGAHAFAAVAGSSIALAVVLAGIAVGAMTGIILPEPRGELLPGRRVRQQGSVLPLFLYLGVFFIRFACGAWAAVIPDQAVPATAIGAAVGTGATARLLVGVVRWKSAPANLEAL